MARFDYPFDIHRVPTPGTKWRRIFDDICNCRECSVCVEADYKPTPFYGSTSSKLVFLGRNPGIDEMRIRIPFVGRTQPHMEDLFSFLGLTREKVYLTNTLKCYTTNPKPDRPPTLEEIGLCFQRFLKVELELLRPQVVVAMGNHALQILTDESSAVTLNGTFVNPKSGFHFKVFAMYHPGYYMRSPFQLKAGWIKAGTALQQYLQHSEYLGGWEDVP